MKDFLKMAEEDLKYFDKRDDADMGDCAYNAVSNLLEYCKVLEERVRKLENKYEK
jgi:hypothetical protein